jgi:hypothetical protein
VVVGNYTGTFTLHFSNPSNGTLGNRTLTTGKLWYNATAAQVAAQLSALPGVGNVKVERQWYLDRPSSNGYTWYVLLADHLTSGPRLAINATGNVRTPSSRPRRLSVGVVVNATVQPLAGSLTFVYGQRCEEWQGGTNCQPARSKPLQVANMSAYTLQNALLSLPAIRNVSVSITRAPTVNGAPSILAHGMWFRITFHEVAINASGTAATGVWPWTWTPEIAAVRWSGDLVVGGEQHQPCICLLV